MQNNAYPIAYSAHHRGDAMSKYEELLELIKTDPSEALYRAEEEVAIR